MEGLYIIIETALKKFRKIWGEAPRGSFKWRRGKAIENVLSTEISTAYDKGHMEGYDEGLRESCIDGKVEVKVVDATKSAP